MPPQKSDAFSPNVQIGINSDFCYLCLPFPSRQPVSYCIAALVNRSIMEIERLFVEGLRNNCLDEALLWYFCPLFIFSEKLK